MINTICNRKRIRAYSSFNEEGNNHNNKNNNKTQVS